MQDGIVNIHGKDYKTVALRVAEFRETHSIDDGWLIQPYIVDSGEVIIIRAEITNPDGRVVAVGHAEEKRNSTQINRTSALENCETSAIGRALAAAGYGGAEYASANEVQQAVAQQDAGEQWEPPSEPPSAKPSWEMVKGRVVDQLMEDHKDLLRDWWGLTHTDPPTMKTMGDALDGFLDHFADRAADVQTLLPATVAELQREVSSA